MKTVAKILCCLLLPAMLLCACSGNGTYTQNIFLTNNAVSADGEDNIYNYNYGDDFSMTSASEAQANNPINEPDPTYYAPKYVNKFLGEDTMIIGGYLLPDVTKIKISVDQSMKDFVDSGCNMLVDNGTGVNAQTSKQIPNMLKSLEKYGGTMIPAHGYRNPQEENVEDAISYLKAEFGKYEQYASFAGIHVTDEPGWKDWLYGRMPQAHEFWNAAYNSKLYFVNLLPIYSPAWSFPNGAESRGTGQYGASLDYDYYYATYVETVKPKVFCYDYYPLKGTFPNLKDQHFLQLFKSKYYAEDYSAQVNGQSIPFWSFIQISGWSATRPATYAEVAWQINTALTFGAKGLQYYIYNAPLGDDEGNPGTPVLSTGEKTSAYWTMQKANNYAQAMAKWFLNANVDHITQVGFTPNGEIIPEAMFIPRDPDFAWRLKDSAGISHLVSHMQYYANNNEHNEFIQGDIQELYLVCNNSITVAGDITLNFGDEIVSGSYIVGEREFAFEGSSLTVNLGAGEAFALLLNN